MLEIYWIVCIVLLTIWFLFYGILRGRGYPSDPEAVFLGGLVCLLWIIMLPTAALIMIGTYIGRLTKKR